MQHNFFRATRVLFLFTLTSFVLFAACAPEETATPTRRPTRALTRPAQLASQPTKVARIAPTETPKPTRTPRPTRTRIPTKPHTPTRVNTPVKRNTRTPTPQVAAAQGNESSVPAPTALTQAPTEMPPEPPAQNTALGVNAACDVLGGGILEFSAQAVGKDVTRNRIPI